jgi:hypothetical protein
MKYGELTFGQMEALVNILGGLENVNALLRGEKEVDLKDAIIQLFDKFGRRIPPRHLQSLVTDANYSCNLAHTELDLVARLNRLFEYLGGSFIPSSEFIDRVDQILEGLKKDESTKNIANGVSLPFALPQIFVDDYGKMLEEVFLPAVERSYKAQFPGRGFTNYREGELRGRITVDEQSRHQRFLNTLDQDVVVGVYFPNCLQGFSVGADLEQMASLPDKFLLSGGFEVCASMIAYPDILARHESTPILHFEALQCETIFSFFFRPTDYYLCFDADDILNLKSGRHSGGLTVLG